MPEAKLLQIGEVAETVGLSLRSVRYYEEVGLIAPERRSDGGFRLYTDEQVERLRVIMQMKPLGFSIQEMLDLITARDNAFRGDVEAKQTLAVYADDARRRCTKLREAVKQGEILARQLDLTASK